MGFLVAQGPTGRRLVRTGVSLAEAASGDLKERRSSERFGIERAVTYRVSGRDGGGRSGTGTTVNISSNGVLFKPDQPLALGTAVELAISWPAQLNGQCALKLVARGRATRITKNGEVAIEIQQYEFRTSRMPHHAPLVA